MRRRVAPLAATAVGIVLVAFLALLAQASPQDGETAKSPLLGRSAPAVKSTTLSNDTFELSRRRGSWVVLNFFNSTCVPCRQEHPELLAFAEQQQTAETPAELYTVMNDDNESAVKAFFAERGGSWPVVRDDDGAIAVAFGVAKVPETWIVDPNGFVRLRVIGELQKGFLAEKLSELQRAEQAG